MSTYRSNTRYPGYRVYEDGRVWTTKRNHWLSQYWCSEGKYKRVKVSVGGKSEGVLVHKLVALAFLGERPTEDHQVNHIDGDQTNNHYSNLEWITQKENLYHAIRSGLHANRFQNVTLISPEGDSVYVENLSEFCRQNGLTQANMWKVINGQRPHHKHWRI